MPNSFTPQQIEEFLQEFFDVVGARQYIGARYVPIFGRVGEDTVEWDNGAPYEPLTVVMHEGVSYVSRRYVPTGIQITDTAYWVETYRFNAQVEQYRQEVLSFQGQIDQIRTDYVPFPDAATFPKYGTLGQVLSTLEGGETKWVDPVVPSDEQAEAVIAEWLADHPEATTTVQDGAITDAKMNANSFYGTDFMPRDWPTGVTRFLDVTTSGIYRITSAVSPSITDKPSFFTTTVGGLLVFNGIYSGSHCLQVLMPAGPNYTKTLFYYRVIDAVNHTVYRDWTYIPTMEDIDAYPSDKYYPRTTPTDITSLAELDENGTYRLPTAVLENVDDVPLNSTETSSMLVFTECLGGHYATQIYIHRQNRMYVRYTDMVNHTQLTPWKEIFTAGNTTAYQTRTPPANITKLATLLTCGSYSIPPETYANLTDLPDTGEASNTATLIVFTRALNGGFVLQAFVTRNLKIFIRYLYNDGTVFIGWKQVYKEGDNVSHNVLHGKKWAICGDSFTNGDFTGYAGTDTTIEEAGPYHGYASVYGYIIANRNNMVAQKLAQNGETLSIGTDSNIANSFTNPNGANNYTMVASDADYITIYYGINDSHHRSNPTEPILLGTIDDTTATTFCGAWNVALEYLITNHPQAKIGIIVSNGCETDEYRQATIAAADKWGIPYIDLNGDERTPMMLRSTNPDVTSSAKNARLAAWRVSTTNTHPNPAAHRYESTIIEAFLRSL